jgi:hypothetical protein
MLFLAKVGAIAVIVWFYLSAQKQNEAPIKWAIIGLIGYWLTWWLVDKTFITVLPAALTRSAVMGFLVMQIPALAAMAAAYLIRGKLVHDAQMQTQVSDLK